MANMSLKLAYLVAVLIFFCKVNGEHDWTPLSSLSRPSYGSGVLQPQKRFSSGESCDMSMGKCNLEQELLMDSEINRRILAQRQYYISYGSLGADRVPCPPGSGRSYYTPNCNSASGPVNPYRRGCSAISRCGRDTH
ncbi:hypothetical protein O6H91_13G093800 [Diphasiastrum complanatum]|nr:hypothetical protein O6H91_13G093800 [Diphasiastrum complanatum]